MADDTYVLVHRGKHATDIYATALAMVREQLRLVDANYSYWDDETIAQARAIVAVADGEETSDPKLTALSPLRKADLLELRADDLLESRSDHEYEGIEWVKVKS